MQAGRTAAYESTSMAGATGFKQQQHRRQIHNDARCNWAAKNNCMMKAVQLYQDPCKVSARGSACASLWAAATKQRQQTVRALFYRNFGYQRYQFHSRLKSQRSCCLERNAISHEPSRSLALYYCVHRFTSTAVQHVETQMEAELQHQWADALATRLLRCSVHGANGRGAARWA